MPSFFRAGFSLVSYRHVCKHKPILVQPSRSVGIKEISIHCKGHAMHLYYAHQIISTFKIWYPRTGWITYYRNCICDTLHNLVTFVKFKKREKHPWRIATFSNSPMGLLHFLSCTNGPNRARCFIFYFHGVWTSL